MDITWQIIGRVQRVGFRYWTIQTVNKIGNISGYIRNADDGSVIVYARGEAADLQRLKAYLYQGPLFARVDNIIDISSPSVYFPPIENGVFKRI